MTNNLSYSDKGLALTKQFEGLRLTAYQDPIGIWTIGYGHTGPEVRRGLTITEDHACDLLLKDVARAVASVNRLVTIALAQNQFDALVDFVFNVGAGKLAGSTLLREVNAGNFAKAASQFPLWVHAGAKVLPGLVERRKATQALFLGQDDTAQSANTAS